MATFAEKCDVQGGVAHAALGALLGALGNLELGGEKLGGSLHGRGPRQQTSQH